MTFWHGINHNPHSLTQSIGGGSESHFEARNLEIIDNGGGGGGRGDQPGTAAAASAVTLDLDTTTSVI